MGDTPGSLMPGQDGHRVAGAVRREATSHLPDAPDMLPGNP